jgi:hypothetical protein
LATRMWETGAYFYDGLKEVTTREGLAQLLWTLIHDMTAPVASGLTEECTEVLKKMVKLETIESDLGSVD